MDSRRYEDLQQLITTNGKLKEAKKVHKRLYALAERLIKEKKSLQEESERQAFEASKAQTSAGIAQQRQESLLMEVMDLNRRLEVLTIEKTHAERSMQMLKESLEESALLLQREREERKSLHNLRSSDGRNSSPKLTKSQAAREFAEGTEYIKRELMNSRQSGFSGQSWLSPERKDKKEESPDEKGESPESKANRASGTLGAARVMLAPPVTRNESQSLRYNAAKDEEEDSDTSSSSSMSSGSSEDSKRNRGKKSKKVASQPDVRDKAAGQNRSSVAPHNSTLVTPEQSKSTRVSFQLPDQKKASSTELVPVLEQKTSVELATSVVVEPEAARQDKWFAIPEEPEDANKESMAGTSTTRDVIGRIDAFFVYTGHIQCLICIDRDKHSAWTRSSCTPHTRRAGAINKGVLVLRGCIVILVSARL